jgi:hypothetical protein
MKEAQKIFEAMMRAKGQTDFTMSDTGKYKVPSMQVRWSYFLLGWEMRMLAK